MTVVPIRLTHAIRFVRHHHRHHVPPVGGLFAVGVEDGGEIVGCAIVGRPVNRHLDDGWTVEVTRVTMLEGHRNGCSMLYGACRRAALAMGYRRCVTYTLESEAGTSLKASGWRLDGRTQGGSWSWDGRPRSDKHPLDRKHRWLVGETQPEPPPILGIPSDVLDTDQAEMEFA